MNNTENIREHMAVVGSCGTHLGTVDHVEGGSVKLTKNDSADGHHHTFPTSWVARVDDQVHLNKTTDAAKHEWMTA